MPPSATDHYTLLGICRDADTATIARACRRRLFAEHPDRHGRTHPSSGAAHGASVAADRSSVAAQHASLAAAEAATRRILEARDVLLDPARRAAYDRTLPRARAAAPRAASTAAAAAKPTRAKPKPAASAKPKPPAPKPAASAKPKPKPKPAAPKADARKPTRAKSKPAAAAKRTRTRRTREDAEIEALYAPFAAVLGDDSGFEAWMRQVHAELGISRRR